MLNVNAVNAVNAVHDAMMRARMMQSVRSAELKTNLAKLWRCAESARWQFGFV